MIIKEMNKSENNYIYIVVD